MSQLVITLIFGGLIGSIEIRQDVQSMADCIVARDAMREYPLRLYRNGTDFEYERFFVECVSLQG